MKRIICLMMLEGNCLTNSIGHLKIQIMISPFDQKVCTLRGRSNGK